MMINFRRTLSKFSFLAEMRRRSFSVSGMRQALGVYAAIFIVWGLYRLLLPFPLVVEEFLIKPMVFLPIIFLAMRKEGLKRKFYLPSLGFGNSGLLLSFYLGMSLGFGYLLVVLMGRLVFSENAAVGPLSPSSLSLFFLTIVSLATALWEQVVFSGYLLQRFSKALGDEWISSILTAILFTLLHVPILWVEFSTEFLFVVLQLFILFLVGFGNSILMLRTRNIAAPVLSHAFWALSLGLIG